MKSLSTLPVVLLSLLSCLSVAFCSPIPARATSDDLVRRSTDHIEKRMIRAGALQAVKAVARISAPKQHPAIAAPPGPKVDMVNYAHKVLSNAGHTAQHYGGVSPEAAHKGVVAGHYAGRTDITKVKITAPAHAGGIGGAHHGPDPTNHITTQPYKGGKPQPKEHVPAPHGFPSVDLKHFPPARSNTMPANSQHAAPKPKAPTRSNTKP